MTHIEETPATILAWAEATFGRAPYNLKIARRAEDEMRELCEALDSDDDHPSMGSEIADVFIVLSQLAERNGIDIQDEVNKKMAKNRNRVWATDGAGCGQHIDDLQFPESDDGSEDGS